MPLKNVFVSIPLKCVEVCKTSGIYHKLWCHFGFFCFFCLSCLNKNTSTFWGANWYGCSTREVISRLQDHWLFSWVIQVDTGRTYYTTNFFVPFLHINWSWCLFQIISEVWNLDCRFELLLYIEIWSSLCVKLKFGWLDLTCSFTVCWG